MTRGRIFAAPVDTLALMGRNDEFDFGKGEEEMKGAEGRAVAGHLWEGMEAILGPMRIHAQHAAVSQLEGQFPGHQIHVDENEDPYHRATHGPWEGRYHAGPYIEIRHRRTDEPVDVINVGENRSFSHDDMTAALKEFHEQSGQDYIDAYQLDRKRRRPPGA